MAKKLSFQVLSGIIGIIIGIAIFSHPATSQQVNFRVNNLESDVRRLEIKLNQIELLINKNSQIPSSRISQTPNKKPTSQRNLSQVERDKMFKRLSTLFVELKQQVNGLEKRLQKLELGE